MDLRGKRVFLSGPMTGLEHNNIAAFAVAHALAHESHAARVYNPAQMWANEPEGTYEDKTHEDYMLDCVNELTRRDYRGKPTYDLLVSLPGWRESDGASHERDVAEHCGIPCVELDDLRIGE